MVCFARRTVVVPSDRVARATPEQTGDLHVSTGHPETALVAGQVDRGPSQPGQPAQPQPLPVEDEQPVGHPGGEPTADEEQPGADVEVTAVDTDVVALQPHPPLGVLRSPVVSDHPAPARHVLLRAVDADRAAERRRRVEGLELGTGQGCAIEPVGPEVPERGEAVVEGQVPGHGRPTHGEMPTRRVGGEHPSGDLHVGARRVAHLVGGDRPAQRDRRSLTERREPEGAAEATVGVPERRVAHPHRPGRPPGLRP